MRAYFFRSIFLDLFSRYDKSMSKPELKRRIKVLTVFGTRPEAIKMAPVVKALEEDAKHFESLVCVTAQHRELLDQVLALFGICPQVDLDIMKPNQDLFQVTTAVLNGMKTVLEGIRPDIVLVHGDTTTTMATSLACFYLKIPVGHVEAGLRTFDPFNPFPEEMNRVVTDSVASLYFAPTERSKNNLLAMGSVDKNQVFVTGNTVIDALYHTLAVIQGQAELPVKLDPEKRLILVTTHRRENFGEPLREICRALRDLVERFDDVEMVLPVHPNPNVKPVVYELLGGHPRIHLTGSFEYAPFCQLIERATLILTDSGGIQEEAPSLSKPILVLRDETERPEAVNMGTVKLVGPHYDAILNTSIELLTNEQAYQTIAQKANPYGDGKAAGRIREALFDFGANTLRLADSTPLLTRPSIK